MVVEHAYSTFMKNLGILVLFSVAFLLGLLMPLLASTPTYSAMGGVHLRFMSIPTMGWIDALAIGVAFLLSNYLVAFGLVAVNLIVKRERTAINLTTEVIKAISRYTFSIFLVFVLLFIINTALQFAARCA